jgi:hypothetical protein
MIIKNNAVGPIYNPTSKPNEASRNYSNRDLADFPFGSL